MIHLAMLSPNIRSIYIKQCLNLLHLLAELKKIVGRPMCRKSRRRPNNYRQESYSAGSTELLDKKIRRLKGTICSPKLLQCNYIFKYSVILINNIGLGFG